MGKRKKASKEAFLFLGLRIEHHPVAFHLSLIKLAVELGLDHAHQPLGERCQLVGRVAKVSGYPLLDRVA